VQSAGIPSFGEIRNLGVGKRAEGEIKNALQFALADGLDFLPMFLMAFPHEDSVERVRRAAISARERLADARKPGNRLQSARDHPKFGGED
jgi:hypothetical protein